MAVWLVFGAAVALTFGWSVDDAFITMRYASNLAHGHGATFNPGMWVEGYSSPLHLVVLTAVDLVPGGGSLLRAKLISVLFAALALAAARRPLRELPVDPWLACLGLLLVAGSSIGAFAAVNGLETSLAAFLVVLLLGPLLDGSAHEHPWHAGVPAGLLLWTRPESPLLLVAVALSLVAVTSAPRRRSLLRWLGVAAAFGAVLVGCRLLLYGELLPNTYRAKHVPIGRALRPGVGYVAVSLVPRATFGPSSAGLVVLDLVLVAVIACFAAGLWWCWRERSVLLVCPAASLAQVVFAVAAGSDWMAGGRYLAPTVVPAVMTLVLGVHHLAGVAARVGPARSQRVGSPPVSSWRAAGASSVLALVLVVAALVPWRLVPRASVASAHGRFDDRSLFESGAQDPWWLAMPARFRCAGPGDTVATTEIGYGPWVRRDVRVMDLSGLTDRRIAARAAPGDHWVIGVFEPDWNDGDSFVVREVLRRRPEVVLVSASVDPRSPFGRAYRPEPGRRFGEERERAFLRRDHPCEAS